MIIQQQKGYDRLGIIYGRKPHDLNALAAKWLDHVINEEGWVIMEDHQVQAVTESSWRIGGIGLTAEALLLEADRCQYAHSLRRLFIQIRDDLRNLRH